MSMGGGSQSSTSKTEPWSAQQPYLKKGFEEAEGIYDQGPSPFYPGQTYTDMADATQQGLNAQTNLASSGNPLVSGASNYATNTLTGQGDNPYASLLTPGTEGMTATARGDFLNTNPWLDDAYNSAAGRVKQDFNETVLPGIAAQMGFDNAAGSTSHELMLGKASGELTDSLGDIASNIYGTDYANERGRMTDAQGNLVSAGSGLYGTGVNERLNAAQMAPGLREAQFGDAAKLREAGGAYETQSGKVLEDDINRFNYNQNADLAALQDYLSMISGNFGSTSTTRSNTGGGGPASAIGAGMSLLSLFA